MDFDNLLFFFLLQLYLTGGGAEGFTNLHPTSL